ncbi:MAG: UDP-4-amino-4-deoxy-L-arabinose--oxoglutarate aminotransferase [Burkholderiaceae bacterium]|nr:UDP-4-amino-4-deoxy-L-arabinose--oxoglutarate aminotransferase [Burkholderiaceae bacterium]
MSHIPYSCQDIDDDDIAAVTAVLRSEYLTQGPMVAQFEDAFARRVGARHAVAVANATAALHVACLALGVAAGSRVWTSPNSFLASANCALYCGASVDFVDIDPVTRSMSVAALRGKLERAAECDELPQVIVPVDFAGLPCDLREMRELADKYGFALLEDASHATGASYQGQPVGSGHAHATVFSFHAVKIVTTAEGGIVTTRDAALAKRLRLLRSHGMTREPRDLLGEADGPWVYEQQLLGYNYRLTDLQAALGWSQLRRLDALHKARVALADRYDLLLRDLPLLLPARLPDRVSAWHLYVVEVDGARTACRRATLFDALRRAQIGANVHYIPIHTQPYYTSLGFKRGDFPAAERYYARAITLPLFPAMTHAQQDRVVDVLRGALR